MVQNQNILMNNSKEYLDRDLDKLALEEGVIDSSNTSNNLDEKEIQEAANNILSDDNFDMLYQTPVVSLEQEVLSREAIEKLNKENKIKEREKQKQQLLASLLENEKNTYYEKHKFQMSGQVLRSTKRKLSQMYDKGKFKNLLNNSYSLN